MSELITRRTFLKAAGTAMAAAAAGGMLAGCGDGAYASTPDGLVAPSIDSSTAVNFSTFTANIGRFDQWTSSSIYEGGERHNYLYAAFNVSAVDSTASVTIKTSDLKFAHTGGSKGTIVGLGYKGLNSDKTDYVFNTSLDVDSSYQKTVILFIDLGTISTSSFQSFYRGKITLTLTKNKQKAVFTYTGLQDAPSSEILNIT